MRRCFALFVALLTVGSAPAGAAGGFTDYRDAAADQYSARNVATTSGASQAQGTSAPQVVGTAGQGASRRPNRPTSGPGSPERRPARVDVRGAHAEAGTTTAPVVATAAPSPAVAAPTGSLPFTGGALGILTLIALAALATGLLIAAVLRLSRRPQRRA